MCLYPKGEVPKYRTYLTMFNAAREQPAARWIFRPTRWPQTEGFHVLKQAARLENFQPHMHLRGKAMLLEAILPDGTMQTISYVNNFNFNWMNNYIYTDDAAPVFPKGHHHPRDRMARQHHRQGLQSRSQPMGGMGRPDGG